MFWVPLLDRLHNTPSVPLVTVPAVGVTLTAAEGELVPALLLAVTLQL
jgi:hypothetical protein